MSEAKKTETEKNTDAQAELDALREDMARIQKDLHALTDTLVDVGKGRARDMRERVEGQWESSMGAVEDYIEEKPLMTVIIAFVAGIIIAKLFGD